MGSVSTVLPSRFKHPKFTPHRMTVPAHRHPERSRGIFVAAHFCTIVQNRLHETPYL